MREDSRWEQAFRRACPAPPAGFCQRHDALLARLTAGEGKPARRAQLLRPLIVCALLLLTAGALAAANVWGLGDFFRSGAPGRQANVARLAPFEEGVPGVALAQDGVRVTLHELVADGRWTYASVIVEAADEGVLPVPYNDLDQRPAGLLPPGDARDYRAYARDEGLRPVGVSVYLESAALAGDYFMDDACGPQGRLMLYMGGETPDGGRAAYALRVITAPEGGDRTDRSVPLPVTVRGGAVTRRYPARLPVGDSGAVLVEARLTLTALCAYLDVTLEGTQLHADLIRDGAYWPRGLSMSVNGYEMDALPDVIDLRLEHPGTGQTWDVNGLKGATE